MTPKLESLDHLVLTVADIDVTIRFYEDALGMSSEVFCPADGSRGPLFPQRGAFGGVANAFAIVRRAG